MIKIKKLVALDMRFNGKAFIVSEFIIGTLFPLILMWVIFYSSVFEGIFKGLVLFWLLGQAFNYAPMTWYAIHFAIKDNYKEYSSDIDSRESVREYNTKQSFIFIPFYFFFLALFQSRVEK